MNKHSGGGVMNRGGWKAVCWFWFCLLCGLPVFLALVPMLLVIFGIGDMPEGQDDD